MFVNHHNGQTDDMRINKGFFDWLGQQSPDKKLMSAIALFEGFVSGDGSYSQRSFQIKLKVLKGDRDHPTLLSIQRLLAEVGIDSKVTGSLMRINRNETELLSILFAAFGTCNCVRKVMHLAAALGIGEANFVAAIRAVGNNEALRAALKEALLIDKAMTLEELFALTLTSDLAVATRANIAWKWAQPVGCMRFRHQMWFLFPDLVRELGLWRAVLSKMTTIEQALLDVGAEKPWTFMEASGRIVVVDARLGDWTPTEKKLLWQLLTADGRNIIQNRSPWIGPYLLGMAEAEMLAILARSHEDGITAAVAIKLYPQFCEHLLRVAPKYGAPAELLGNLRDKLQVGRGRVCCAPEGFVYVIKRKGAKAVAPGVFESISKSASESRRR